MIVGTGTMKTIAGRFMKMPRFIVDLWLDGYDTKEEMNDACDEDVVEEALRDASFMVVSVERIEK